MAGISSKALAFGNPENKYKYNGIEKENDLQIEIYDAQLRELDGQLGVWWQIDPKTESMEMWSPYASNYDNPLRYSDPLGDEGQECCKFLWSLVGSAAATLDNTTGINLRKTLAPSSRDKEAVEAYNTGQDIGDAGSMVIGMTEAVQGGGMVAGGSTVAATGLGAAPGAVVAGTGGLMVVHGGFTFVNGTNNLFNQKDRVKTEDNTSTSNYQKSESDKKLIEEAEKKKAKENASNQRQANQQTATNRSNNRTGNSNQQTRGDHNSSTSNSTSDKHSRAQERRGREQAAADQRNKKKKG